MPIPILILSIVLCMSAAGLLTYWTVAAGHVLRSIRRVPRAAAALGYPEAEGGDLPSVCVIVPAHNEEECIAGIARSLLAQDIPSNRLRIIFSLDRCTDGTQRVVEGVTAGDARAEIRNVTECPADWTGKSHALWRAVQDAPAACQADVLAFVDADTLLHPSCLRATIAMMRRRELDFLSLLSTLTAERWFEKVVQPAAAMELLRQYPIVRANAAKHRRPFANGQFIMVRREAYERFGGHEAVKHEVLEDVKLARQAAAKGLRLGLFVAGDLLHCRMYSAYTDFRRGWKRIYSESVNRRPGRLRRFAWRMRLVSVLLPVLTAACLCVGIWQVPDPLGWIAAGLGALALVAWLGTIGWCLCLFRAPVWCVPAYAAGAWAASSIMLEAARDLEKGRPTKWAGREYVRESR